MSHRSLNLVVELLLRKLWIFMPLAAFESSDDAEESGPGEMLLLR